MTRLTLLRDGRIVVGFDGDLSADERNWLRDQVLEWDASGQRVAVFSGPVEVDDQRDRGPTTGDTATYQSGATVSCTVDHGGHPCPGYP